MQFILLPLDGTVAYCFLWVLKDASSEFKILFIEIKHMALQLVSVIQKIWPLIEDAIKHAAPSEVLELELYWSLTQISETVYKIVYIPTHVLVLYDFPSAPRTSPLLVTHIWSLFMISKKN